MNKSEMFLARQALAEGIREKLEKELTEPRFTVRETGISYRRLTHWKNEDLLVGTFKEGRWRRLDYLEVIWIRIVGRMRDFELPLSIIRNMKSQIWSGVSSWELYQESGIREVIGELEGPGNRDFHPLDPDTMEAMKQDTHPWLFFIVMDAILFRNHWMILINRQGGFVPLKLASIQEYRTLFSLPEFITGSFISVSLSEVVSESLLHLDFKVLEDQLFLVTPKEAEVLKHLRKGGLKSLKITFDGGGEVDLIEETAVRKVDPSAHLVEILWMRGYQTITAKTQDGRITHFECTTRFKLN